MRACAVLLFLITLCLPPVRASQAPAGRLVSVVLVTRHGLRSPLVPNATLNRYSVRPWPAWPVAPGVLTARGAEQLRLLGVYDGAMLRRQGLLASACAGASSAYFWTDTDQRTRASGAALAQGIFPGCPVAMHGLPPGTYDPLFNLTRMPVPPALAAAAVAQVSQCARPTPQLQAAMRQVQALLQDCGQQGACAARPALSMLNARAYVRPSSNGVVDWQGPLPLASSFAEDFELEYLQGMPMSSVAWGSLTPEQLNALIALHTRYIACLDDTPALAALGASDLLAHIAATLQQGVQQHAGPGAFSAPAKLTVVAGHDSNLVGLASLLGLHWRLDGRADDTPPASALLFELWRSPQGQSYVRVLVQMPPLSSMRTLMLLTLAHPPLMQQVTPRGCSAGPQGCPWLRFSAAVAHSVDRRFVRE